MNTITMKKSLYTLGFVIVLLAAIYFRLIGLDWDQSQNLHPDERFMTMVTSALEPAKSFGEYFDTLNSPLNPNNRGYTFYVYGDMPIIVVRYVAEWMNQISAILRNIPAVAALPVDWLERFLEVENWAGYGQVFLVGRVLSALSDIASLIFVYLIAKRLYSKKVALLAMALSAAAVMQIQQSHFFTVDMFANFFMVLATFFAVEVMVAPERQLDVTRLGRGERGEMAARVLAFLREPVLWNVIGFGLAFGAAVASKINAAPLAILLPAALVIRLYDIQDVTHKEKVNNNSQINLLTVAALCVVGGVVFLLAFRVFMPYAFSGPEFLNLNPNPAWMETIATQRAQASGDVDFPPALQWTRRSFWYSGANMIQWGLGIPFGVLVVLGFAWMGWKILAGKKTRSLFLWGWVGLYFLWQSTQWNPTMRYQLPIYPMVAIIAAWFIFNGPTLVRNRPRLNKGIYLGLAGTVLLLTVFWAYAFTRIYTVDHTRVQATRWIMQNVPGPMNVIVSELDGSEQVQPLPFQVGLPINADAPYETTFNANHSGSFIKITFARIANLDPQKAASLEVSIFDQKSYPGGVPLASGTTVIQPGTEAAPNQALMNKPVFLLAGQPYVIRLQSSGGLTLRGASPIMETSWDDGLPLRMDGYDPFGGIYTPELNLELYWDDNAEKLARFTSTLNAGEYIFISSNRQWGTTTRVPERYPLTSKYYRELIGCPPEKEILWCYNVATPGLWQGNLGFDLVQTFTSYPRIFGLEINTQFADEAFTVYDAPKVLLFKKTDGYDPAKVARILGSVDLAKVVHVTPRSAPRVIKDLMQTPANALRNADGGTWAELFPVNSPLNTMPAVGLLVWYLSIFGLGLFTFPLFFYLFSSLPDRGYPLARLGGMLFTAYAAWLLASTTALPYSREVILALVIGLVAAGAVAFYLQRQKLIEYIQENRKYIGLIEIIFLLLFLVDLAIRLGNPDLWHPYKGGERPMDFSFLNAVLKSTTFPPYDPWYAGGTINYYYWGFVLVGTPIKLLGISPSIAYNFVLPTLFALLGLGGFSVVWNLLANDHNRITRARLAASFGGAAGLVLLGNLGTVQLLYRSLQKMAVSNEMVDAAGVLIFQRWAWAVQGLGRLLASSQLPIGVGDYYWAPSRVMPVGDLAITEFPLFTFIYSDLHAHMIALPVTLLVILWVVSVLLRKSIDRTSLVTSMVFGGFLVGVLRPTNTWDFPTYLILALCGVTTYVLLNREIRIVPLPRLDEKLHIALNWLICVGLLYVASQVFFEPFTRWYGTAYGKVDLWQNEKTPIWSYLTQWGLFLFVILMWMGWETRQWLATTPVSALTKVLPYKGVILMFALGIVLSIIGIQVGLDVPIAWFVLSLALWALILMLKPGNTIADQFVLFLVGTGFLLTIMVEIIVLSGDIGRMNTVFKFYLQVWTLFVISAGYAFGRILLVMKKWGQRRIFLMDVVGLTLLAGALMFTLTASYDKIRDRMSGEVPFTFDSMTYMQFAKYWDQQELDLSKDYKAIRWMQQNVQGSPVIVEANSVEYRWGSRYTIYTGLPGVVGWNWHERQQRALFPGEWVSDRVLEIAAFYNDRNIETTVNFLRKYDVKYIIVGQLEQQNYEAAGLQKFNQFDGIFWKSVYDDSGVQIYEVIQ